MTIRVRHPLAFAATLVALLLLSYASVRSTVMQVAMASPAAAMAMPMCGGSATAATTAAGPGAHLAHGTAPGAASKSCPYCAAAAHPPVLDGLAPSAASTSAVFVAYVASRPFGPRGPPACRPRARGPPLTA